MGLFHNRPLAVACFLFVISLTACALIGALFSLIFGVLVLISLLSLLIYAMRSRKWRRLALVLACLASLTLGSIFGLFALHAYAAKAEGYGDLRVTIEGTVTDTVEGESASVFFLRVDRINGEYASGLLYVPYEEDSLPARGDRVRFSASFSAPSEWDGAERYYRLADGVFAEAELVTDLVVTEASTSRFSVFSLRERLSARLSDAVEGDAGAVMSAMLLGRREFLSSAITRNFRRTGLSHVLCISGFHLALLGGLALKLFRTIGLRRRAAYAAMALTVIAYTTLIGFPVSAVRAGIMLVIIALSKILFRRSDTLTSLAVAAALITLFSPYAVYDFGFWLSVVATFGIVVYTEYKRAKTRRKTEKPPLPKRILAGIGESLSVTLCAILATLPFTALFFGEFSLLAPLTNLLLVPLLEGYLILSIPALLLGTSFLSPLFSLLGQTILRAVAFFSDGRGTVMSLDFLSIKILLFVLLFSFLALLCMDGVTRSKIRVVLLPQALLITILFISLHGFLFSQNAVSYTIISKNEALVLYSQGKGMLCDYSDGGYAAERMSDEQERRLRLSEYEAYVLTHYHKGHPESIKAILSRVKVRNLYLPVPQTEEENALFEVLADIAAEAGTDCLPYTENTPISLGKLTFIPHSGVQVNGHVEGACTVLSENARLTYLGGAYQQSEFAYVNKEAVAKSTHLLFGLHGSSAKDPVPYTRFSETLELLLLPYPSRLSNALKSSLDAQNVLYRTQEKWEYIHLD